MLKGTINTQDFYGRIESIETTLPVGTTVVNKASGQRFKIETVNKMVTGFYAKITMYSICRIGGTYTRFIDSDLLKKRYWKVV